MSERRRLYVSLVVLFFWASCTGGGCSGCSSVTAIPGGFSYSRKIDNALQVRLSSSGVAFLEDHGAEIAESFLGESLVQTVSETDVTVGTLCGGGAACTISVTMNSLNLTPNAPNLLTIDPLRVSVVSSVMPLQLLGSSCLVTIDTSRGSPGDAGLRADVAFVPDPGSARMGMMLQNPEVIDFSSDDVRIDGEEWYDVACPVASFLLPFFLDRLLSMLTDPIEDAMSQFCVSCANGEACPEQSFCDGSQCIESSGRQCVMSFGEEGRMSLNAALQTFSPGIDAATDFLAWLGGYAAAPNNGLSLGMLGGALSDQHDPCVPDVALPSGPAIPISSVLAGNSLALSDGASYPFDVGIGIHKRYLDTFGWAMFDAGALCINLTSDQPQIGAFLNSATVGVFFNLTHLVHDETSLPLILAVRPQEPPTFEIGAGIVSYDAEGGAVIDEPLITVRMQRLGIDLYALVDQRIVRLARVYSDLALPIALDTDGFGNIIPLVGDVTEAFTNLSAEGTELLVESPEEIAETFPSVFALVGGFLGDVLPPIALPNMQGFELVDPRFHGVESNTLLGIFTQLSFMPPAAAVRPVETTVDVTAIHVPATDAFHAGGQARPTVDLTVGAEDGALGELEWSWRLDGGLWSVFQRRSQVTIESPALRLQGRHRLEVRARAIGYPRTLDPTPVTADLLIDSIPPDLEVEIDGDHLQIAGRDNVTSESDLEFSVVAHDADPTTWQRGAVAVAYPVVGEVTVFVRDEAGNQERRAFHGHIPPVATAESGCSCAVGQETTEAPWPVLWVLLGVALVWVRRRCAR